MEFSKAQDFFSQVVDKMKAYEYALSLSNWDMSTLAPKKGKPAAARAQAVLYGELYDIQTSAEMKEVLKTLTESKEKLTDVRKREVEIFLEDIEKIDKIPKEEYTAFQELQANAQNIWEDAKANNDFALFAPYLEKIVAYRRKFVALTHPGMSAYDACLDDYEKGLNTKDLDVFFEAVKEVSVPLIKKIADSGKKIEDSLAGLKFPKDKQMDFSKKILKLMTFDLDAGIIAESVHPFTTGLASGDVRLTTFCFEDKLVSSLFSTLHEGGHGIYNQHAYNSEIVGDTSLSYGASMSIHESQSRFFENAIGRSYEFWQYFYSELQATFKDQLKDVSLDDFYETINISRPSLIRTEADELTYNMHIIIRYEIEKDLMEGKIEVNDLPKKWNDKYEAYLGIRPKTNSTGVLQDVHWSGGMIGYFPSYALGNAYAAQIMHKMGESLDIPALCKAGNIAAISDWLNENIHKYGTLKKPSELIKDVSGEKLNPKYLTDYLSEKFEKIYF